MKGILDTAKTWLVALKELVFPIRKEEISRFLPMALMMLFILFNYTVLRNTKDTLVINAKGADESIISFIKLWGTTPSAILFMVFYSKLANLFSREKLFYICISFFIGFFALFGFVIYPNVDYLHPSADLIKNLQASFPYIKHFIAMWGSWSYCLFYILSELWGSVMLSLMFWQFANETTKPEEAKRFYPMYGFISNIGLIVAGITIAGIGKVAAGLFPGSDVWQVSLQILMGLMVASGGIITALYYHLNRKSEKEQLQAAGSTGKKKKMKLSIVESFKYIFSSSHLLCIAILVLSYGVAINYIDVLWKGQVRIMANGDNMAFQDQMARFSTLTGVITMILMLLGGYVLRKFTWRQAASIVPTILMATSIIFFGVIIYGNHYGFHTPMLTLFGSSFTAVMIAAQMGAWQGAITKASKYSLFDSTKEMAYIPLDNELRSKGKAAVDVAGGRLGKSGGSLTFFILQTLIPSATTQSLAPYLAVVSFAIFIAWFFAIGKLSKSLDEMEQEEQPAVAA
jgi:AAA family ATP:ADP antiporter